MLWKVFDRQSPANTNWHLIIRNTCSTLLRMEDLRCSIYRSPFIPWNNFIHDFKKFFSSCLLFTTAVLNVSKRSLLQFFSPPLFVGFIISCFIVSFMVSIQSEVPFVIPFSSWQIITLLSFISNTFVSFFSVAFHQSPCFSCQFFLFCTGSSYGFPSLL